MATDEKVLPGRRKGWISHINGEKGFAFIRGVDFEEYFAHVKTFSTAHWESLTVGQHVTFEAVDTIKGLRSARVRIATVEEGDEIVKAKARFEARTEAREDSRGNRSHDNNRARGRVSADEAEDEGHISRSRTGGFGWRRDR